MPDALNGRYPGPGTIQIGTSKAKSDDMAKWHNMGMHPPKNMLKTLFMLTHESRKRTSGHDSNDMNRIDVGLIANATFVSLIWSEPDD